MTPKDSSSMEFKWLVEPMVIALFLALTFGNFAVIIAVVAISYLLHRDQMLPQTFELVAE